MTCDIQHQRDMLHDWSMRGTLFFCFEIGADFPFGEEHISMPQRLWRRTARPFQSRECVDHQGWEGGSFEISPLDPVAAYIA